MKRQCYEKGSSDVNWFPEWETYRRCVSRLNVGNDSSSMDKLFPFIDSHSQVGIVHVMLVAELWSWTA